MASNYPGSLDSFDTIASDKKTSDAVGGRTHRQMHNDVADALEAVQAELGTDPAGTFATVKARLAAYDAYAAKTSAYTATVNDNTLNVTSGTFTLDLPAASTCTGKTLKVKNSGTGVVTLDGNSSETVEAVATFPLGPGSYVEITSTGSVWILTGGTPDTGWRKATVSDTAIFSNATYNSANPNSVFYLRRQGRRVSVKFSTGTSPTFTTDGQSVVLIPVGWRPGLDSSTATLGPDIPLFDSSSGALVTKTLLFASGENTQMRNFGSWASGGRYRGGVSWATSDAWPTSLPGSAA